MSKNKTLGTQRLFAFIMALVMSVYGLLPTVPALAEEGDGAQLEQVEQVVPSDGLQSEEDGQDAPLSVEQNDEGEKADGEAEQVEEPAGDPENANAPPAVDEGNDRQSLMEALDQASGLSIEQDDEEGSVAQLRSRLAGPMLQAEAVSPTISIPVNVTWNDDNNSAGERPSTLHYYLYALEGNSNYVLKQDKAGSNTGVTFTNVPKYANPYESHGQVVGATIVYYVAIPSIEHYSITSDADDVVSVSVGTGHSFISTLSSQLNFTISYIAPQTTMYVQTFTLWEKKTADGLAVDNNEWGNQPSSVTYSLYAGVADENGYFATEPSLVAQKTSSEESPLFRCEFGNVPLYDSDGHALTYMIGEPAPVGYEESYACAYEYDGALGKYVARNKVRGSNGSAVVAIYQHAKQYRVEWEGYWRDANHEDSRPDSITLRLKANGEDVATYEVPSSEYFQGRHWFSDDYYPAAKNGVEVNYTLTVDDITSYSARVGTSTSYAGDGVYNMRNNVVLAYAGTSAQDPLTSGDGIYNVTMSIPQWYEDDLTAIVVSIEDADGTVIEPGLVFTSDEWTVTHNSTSGNAEMSFTVYVPSQTQLVARYSFIPDYFNIKEVVDDDVYVYSVGLPDTYYGAVPTPFRSTTLDLDVSFTKGDSAFWASLEESGIDALDLEVRQLLPAGVDVDWLNTSNYTLRTSNYTGYLSFTTPQKDLENNELVYNFSITNAVANILIPVVQHGRYDSSQTFEVTGSASCTISCGAPSVSLFTTEASATTASLYDEAHAESQRYQGTRIASPSSDTVFGPVTEQMKAYIVAEKDMPVDKLLRFSYVTGGEKAGTYSGPVTLTLVEAVPDRLNVSALDLSSYRLNLQASYSGDAIGECVPVVDSATNTLTYTFVLNPEVSEAEGRVYAEMYAIMGSSLTITNGTENVDITQVQFSNLVTPDFTQNGQVFSLEDFASDHYGKSFNFKADSISTPGVATVDIPVQKTWNDDNNELNNRPSSVTYRLYAAVPSTSDARSDEEPVLVATLEATEENDYATTFMGLPVEDESGNTLVYCVGEDAVPGYTAVNAYVARDGGYDLYHQFNGTDPVVITNRTVQPITMALITVWEDADNEENRPESTTVRVLADGQEVDAQEMDSENSHRNYPYKEEYRGKTWWKYSSSLPAYRNGQPVAYTVAEDAILGYQTTVEQIDYATMYGVYGLDLKGITPIVITNTYTPSVVPDPETVNIPVRKVWDDNDNQLGCRPDSVTFLVYANCQRLNEAIEAYGLNYAALTDLQINDGYYGTPVAEHTFSGEGNEWESVIEGLPAKDDQGDDIQYTVVERYPNASKPCGATNLVWDGTNPVVITNQPITANITIAKIWDDNDNAAGARPESITVHLMRGEEEIESHTLNKSDATIYAKGEKQIPSPDGAGLVLNEVGEEWVWGAVFTGMPSYEKDGTKIDYVVTEDGVEGYVLTQNTRVIKPVVYYLTNTYTGSTKTSIPVVKAWRDAGYESRRPESITVHLYADGEDTGKSLTMTAENASSAGLVYVTPSGKSYHKDKECGTLNHSDTIHEMTLDEALASGYEDPCDKCAQTPDDAVAGWVRWSHNGAVWMGRFDDLDRFDAEGNQIAYTLVEDAVDGYRLAEIDRPSAEAVVLYNELVPEGNRETASVSVTKKWVDDNNAESTRPKNITIRLYADGKQVSSAVLDEKNQWSWLFDYLDKYDENGKEIAYTISEDQVAGYVASVKEVEAGSADNEKSPNKAFYVQNTHSKQAETKKPNIVPTGDATAIMAVLTIVVAACGATIVWVKRR